ncbi:MAG TPA: bacillithiol biosynthesis BshC [Gemmatimonadaceae bacterium]|jgi:uncharacterized protein YllA (UPF0747 family)
MTDVRIVTEPLGGSPLSRAMQSGDVPATWSPPRPSSTDAWRSWAKDRLNETDWSQRLAALAPAMQATGAAAERLDRVRREGGVVVTTGQQPALFGGPLYTWTKAASALALADAIEQRTGIPTAPVFWAATDDADFTEASRTVVARPGGVDVLRATHEPPDGTPMSLAPLGSLEDALHRLQEAAGSASDPRPLAMTVAAYSAPECSTGDAFVQLLRGVLAPFGMPVLDASHPAVRDASMPTLASALRAAGSIESALATRSREIVARGLVPQVEDVGGLSLVFTREGSVKRRLTTAEAARGAAGWLTPNVLLRPIVERAILPTIAYVGGPGELAYFAQVSAVASALGQPSPLAVPRWSATLVEPHVQQLLDRFDVEIAALAEPHTLEGTVARRAMSEDAKTTLRRLRATIAALPAELASEAAGTGTSAAVEGASKILLHRVDRLERRLLAGVKRRETALLRDVATLRGALYPLGVRQERMLNGIPIFARHGLSLVEELQRAASMHAERLIDSAPRASHVGSAR